jgi:hypothetical protein
LGNAVAGRFIPVRYSAIFKGRQFSATGLFATIIPYFTFPRHQSDGRAHVKLQENQFLRDLLPAQICNASIFMELIEPADVSCVGTVTFGSLSL